jgi:hypothetical protein
MGDSSGLQDSSGYLAESRQDVVRGVAATFLALDTIVIAMRFISKRIGSVKFGWDDAWITCGYLCSIAIIACSLGKHINGTSLLENFLMKWTSRR